MRNRFTPMIFLVASGYCLAKKSTMAMDVANKRRSGSGRNLRASTYLLRAAVVDSESQSSPLSCRVYVRSTTGTWYFPKSSSAEGSAVEYKRQVGPNSLEQHVTVSAHPIEVELPSGTIYRQYRAGKGIRTACSHEVVVQQQPVDIKLPLIRWINMSKAGWYSGDVHAHRGTV